MGAIEAYLAAASGAADLLRQPEVAAAWERPSALAGRADAALAGQRSRLPERPAGDVVYLPQTGRALTLGDFLTTRTMELAVHADDLAVSVGLAAAELPDVAFDPLLILLARLAARRHGQTALLRALARGERAPAAISAI